MRSLDLGGDAKRYGVTAANRTEAEKVEVAAGEIISGKAAKISFTWRWFRDPCSHCSKRD